LCVGFEGEQFLFVPASGADSGAGDFVLETLFRIATGGLGDRLGGRRWQSGLNAYLFEMLSRPFDGEPLFVEEMPNREHRLDVRPSIQALSRAGFLRANGGEFGFPVTKDVWLDIRELRDFSDFEKEFVRQIDSSGHDSPSRRRHRVSRFVTAWG